jgi:hypothetical protein
LSARVSRIAVLGLLIAVAMLGSQTAGPRAAARVVCAASPGTTVGSLTTILHTNVLVAGKNIGAAPCDLIARNTIQTDQRGQAVFRLSQAGRETKCILLSQSSLVVSPESRNQEPVIRFTGGRSWCSTSGGRGGFFSPRKVPRFGDIRLTTATAVFGVSVGSPLTATVVKVRSASDRAGVQVRGSDGVRVAVKSGQEARVTSSGSVSTARTRLDAADRLALVQLGSPSP